MTRSLPSQFPCLVKAIYSFAGQSKGDLGFVQGDLIECLNAGDGQWWFGRLKRNKTIGLFPCNYVELADDEFASKSPNSVSRPSSSRSHSRSNLQIADKTSLRSLRSYEHDMYTNYRPSSAPAADNQLQLQPKRSMTSMSQHSDNYPRHSCRSPSPAFYPLRYPSYTYDEQNYGVDYLPDVTDRPNDWLDRNRHQKSPNSHCQNAVIMPPNTRQTPSPLRWAMQDLMDSLDAINTSIPSPSFYHGQLNTQLGNLGSHIQEESRAYVPNTYGHHAGLDSDVPLSNGAADVDAPDGYPQNISDPGFNYIETTQSRSPGFMHHSYAQQLGQHNEYSLDNEPSISDSRIHSPRSDELLPQLWPFQPPMPPPHMDRHREDESVTSHSIKHSIFSSNASETSTTPSTGSAGSAGSAASFARRKLQQSQERETASQRTGLNVFSKVESNGLLKRRKSYGSSLKKSIGKLLNTSPSKPAPGTISDHGDKVIEWQNVRRDVNRANTPSLQERTEYRERLEMEEGTEFVKPIEFLENIIEGDESSTGNPILPDETFDITRVNFSLIDRATRLINQIPPQYISSPSSFAKSIICRPYASDIQRLRAIFVFLSEKFTWHPLHTSDALYPERSLSSLQRFFETRRGTSEDVAWCFWEMCRGCNIQAEIISGYLKSPLHDVDPEIAPQPNHFWNAVIVNGEWRMVDASLASPTHPKRPPPPTKSFEPFYFLTRPSEFLYTHVPLLSPRQQHVLARDRISTAIQLALPYTCPAYFEHDLVLQSDFDISHTRLEDLQVACIDVEVPENIECVAEVESQVYGRDLEGDLFESGEFTQEAALAQPLWLENPRRRVYRVKGFLNCESARGTLKIYAGKKGLMTSALDNPHRLALTLPLSQRGTSQSFRFVVRHPTPHAQRYDLYVRQPQCRELRVNQTYVFSVIQSPSSSSSPINTKPAKLSIQSPGGKIIKLSNRAEPSDGTWEALVKCGEKGSWKGLVLGATSRWCAFCEWECI